MSEEEARVELADHRVLVVGASAGLGRATGLHLSELGARVAFAARRPEPLEEAAREAASEAIAVTCDVRDEASCEAAVEQTVEAFGGLDSVVYSTGGARPVWLKDAGPDAWRWSLEINLVGASLITRAALPHLAASRGRMIYFSSISANDQVPRSAMALYVTSKAALNKLIEAWRGEHPEVAFTRLQIGDTLGTEFGQDWTPEDLAHAEDWAAKGLMFGRVMKPNDVAEVTAHLLSLREDIPILTLQPRMAVD